MTAPCAKDALFCFATRKTNLDTPGFSHGSFRPGLFGLDFRVYFGASYMNIFSFLGVLNL